MGGNCGVLRLGARRATRNGCFLVRVYHINVHKSRIRKHFRNKLCRKSPKREQSKSKHFVWFTRFTRYGILSPKSLRMSQSIAIPGFVHERRNDILHISKVQNTAKVVSKKRQRITMYRTRSFLRYSMSRAVRSKHKRRPLLYSSVKIKEKALYRRNKRYPKLLQNTFANQIQQVQPVTKMHIQTKRIAKEKKLKQQATKQSTNKGLYLNTHIWHVKRFYMEEQNSWKIPRKHRNRGLKAVDGLLDHCILQDTSYLLATIQSTVKHKLLEALPSSIQLTGSVKSVDEFMKHFIEPSLQLFNHEEGEEGQPVLLEAYEREVVIFQANCFPNSCIGPVTLLFIPDTTTRLGIQVWVSCHPTIACEVYTQFFSKSGECVVRTQPPRLNRFSLRGSCCAGALLALMDEQSEDKTQLYVRSLLCLKSISKHSADGEVFSFSIPDPRIQKSQVKNKEESQKESNNLLNNPPSGMSLGSSLYDAQTSYNFRRDHDLNEEKHKMKVRDWEALFTTTTPFGAQAPTTVSAVTKNSNCPILLIRKELPTRQFRAKVHQLSGWDVLLPAEWAGTIFSALQVHGGATVVGSEEMAHIHAKTGVPSFPRDYLDTPAGREFWITHHSAILSQNSRMPPQKKLLHEDMSTLLRRSSGERANIISEINSILIVRGEPYLRDFRPPAYESLDIALIMETHKGIEATDSGNTSDDPSPWVSPYIPKLPTLPPLMFLQVLLVPTCRGLAHDLAEIICPTTQDVEMFVQHKLNFKRKRAATRQVAEPEAEARLFGQTIHGSLYGHQVQVSGSGGSGTPMESAVNIALCKDWEGVQLTEQRIVLTEQLHRREISEENDDMQTGTGTVIENDRVHQAKQDIQAGEGDKRKKSEHKRKTNSSARIAAIKEQQKPRIKNYFDYKINEVEIVGDMRKVIGTVTSGQQAHLNNSHFAVGLCNINALNDMFRRSFGRFPHPQAHILVLFRNPRSEWLRPAVLQII